MRKRLTYETLENPVVNTEQRLKDWAVDNKLPVIILANNATYIDLRYLR